MKSLRRAGGIAAAAFALVAGTAYSNPSMAGETGSAANGPTYLAHASATTQSAEEAAPGRGLLPQLVNRLFGEAATQVATPAPLSSLVSAYEGVETDSREQECLAGAVYFEARSEPLEGQLAVADVVINRSNSGRYPTDVCDVITQRAQFSFIRNGRFPKADRSSAAWRKAVAIARIAENGVAAQVAPDVLWYHADYVAPIWRHGLTRSTKIGVHIFYS